MHAWEGAVGPRMESGCKSHLVMRLPPTAYGARHFSIEGGVFSSQSPPFVGTNSLTSSFMSVRKNSFLPRPLNV